MDKFCIYCGSELKNGICPTCSLNNYYVQSKTQMYYQQKNYQQGYSQQNQCTVCGTILIDGICPNCISNRTIENQNNKDKRFTRVFASPKEKLVTTLGNKYIENYLNNGSIQNGFAIVSNKRAYFIGNSYEVTYNKGKKEIKKTSRSRTVDLKDVTGTGTDYSENILYLVAAIAFFCFIILAPIITGGEWDVTIGIYGLIFLPMSIVFWLLYFASKKALVTIQFAGGEIAFNINWFPQKEIKDFQKQLRVAKDKAQEDASTAIVNQFSMAMNNMGYNQNQMNSTSVADELMKYAELLQKGLITEEEYNYFKRGLL